MSQYHVFEQYGYVDETLLASFNDFGEALKKLEEEKDFDDEENPRHLELVVEEEDGSFTTEW